MRVRVRLIGVDAAGPGIGADGEGWVELQDGATPDDLLRHLGIAGTAEPYMTIVNEAVIGPGDRARHRLAPDDLVTVFPPMEGG